MTRLFALASLAALVLSTPAVAQQGAPQTATQPGAQQTVLHARTASELADLCGSKPTDAPTTAKLNFCLGYAQATLDAALRQSGGKRSYCIPQPSPTRQQTMGDFAAWVRATPAAAGQNAQEALLRFMGQRFPCKT